MKYELERVHTIVTWSTTMLLDLDPCLSHGGYHIKFTVTQLIKYQIYIKFNPCAMRSHCDPS